ncbi:MAG: hypothetical protein COB20_06780 [SAR86 cluster bacterium]|uniref:Peptidase M1 membrane alanine aminopeptidase domain-containing protein n=1 Tax=SAR86 cluster bacterium TaxID=2030880 RepID=A0A2A4X6T5_9GAMM|nr:MAG: hypothetical protein COB20_06780 [SAR86 cluster bacterium]
MLTEIIRYEFRYLLRSPLTISTFLVFLIWGFLSFPFINNNEGVIYSVVIGSSVNLNSPFLITICLVGMSVLAAFFIPAFISNAVLKDCDYNFEPILFSTPISKERYLVGRFSGAFAVLMLTMLGGPIGMLLAASILSMDFNQTEIGFLLQDLGLLIDSELLAQTNVWDYLIVYFVYLVPLMLFLSVIIYSVTLIFRHAIYAYLSVVGLLMLFLAGSSTDSDGRILQALVDPFMLDAFIEQSRFWTSSDRNTNLIGYQGIVLQNRLVWLIVACSFSFLAFRMYSFSAGKSISLRNWIREMVQFDKYRIRGAINTTSDIDDTNMKDLRVGIRWNKVIELRQFLWRTKFECLSVLKSPAFIIVLLFSASSLLAALLDRGSNIFGSRIYPLTRVMIEMIGSNLDVIILVVVIIFSADIIWRERKERFSEIIDTLPTPNWVFVISKLLALVLILSAILFLCIGISIVVQVSSNYENIEFGLYVERGYFYLVTAPIFIAVLAYFVHVLVKNRFFGIMIMVLYLVSYILFQVLGVAHPLYYFGLNDFPSPLSDMNAAGRFTTAGYWLRIYWSMLAVILLLFTYILWNRGTPQPLRYRLRGLRQLRSTVYWVPLLIALSGSVGTGYYIFYNTNILNDFVTSDKIDAYRLTYENRYRQYEKIPMPRVVDVKAEIDIYPNRRRVEARATQILRNKTDQSISTVHLSFPADIDIKIMELDGSQLVSFDEEMKYAIFDLDIAMKPGEERSLYIETLIVDEGFEFSRPNLSFGRTAVNLVRNGTYLNRRHILPYIGFSPNVMINDNSIRRKYNLEPIQSRENIEGIRSKNGINLRHDSDFFNFEATISTSESQTAISAGSLEKEWIEGGRRYFTYKSTAPVKGYPLLSAEYEVARDEIDGIEIEVYYHKSHSYNLGRIIESAKDSLNYYSQVFGPYQYEQLKIVETAAYHGNATASSGIIAHSVHLGFITEVAGRSDIDVPYYVTAHEIAHQWWSGQIFTANTQGDAMMSETLAQYAALMVMEKEFGEERVRKFLRWELDRYLAGRANDSDGESPLYKVEGDAYIHTNKGAVVMYALKDYIGEGVINRSLRRLLNLRQYSTDPYTVATDFLDILKEEVESEYQGLIQDLFEKITFFDLKIRYAGTEVLRDGRYKTSLEVEASKFYADANGMQNEVELELPVDIGLFLSSPTSESFGVDDIVSMEKIQIASGESVIEIITNERPFRAGIDPYGKLIELDSSDNVVEVQTIDPSR